MALDVDVDNEISNKQEKMYVSLGTNIFMATMCYVITVRLIPKLKEKFIKANLFGIDMSKTTSDKV